MMDAQKRGEHMYKIKEENVEVYFICYKKEDMDLVESYYDEVLDIHYWYFNAYLAYKLWKKKFKGLEVQELSKQLLVVAASRYLIYVIENEEFKTPKEYNKIVRDLDKIQKELTIIINGDNILKKL